MFTQKTTTKTWYSDGFTEISNKLAESEKRLKAARELNHTLELEMIQLRGQYDQLRLKLRKEGT